MVDTVFEDEDSRIARSENRRESREKHTNPTENIFSMTANLQDRKCKPPFTIIISFRRPDITISSTKNLRDDMPRSRLAK